MENDVESINNALVVLNYNDADGTDGFVKMASKCASINKIVVVDNCSPDGSFAILEKLKNDKVDVIKTEYNGGYAYGNNVGCRYAIEKYNPEVIFISNPDVQFQDDVIARMQDELLKNNNIGVIAPIVNQGYNVWNLPGFLGVVESVFLLWHNLDKKKIKKKLINSENDVEFVGVVEGSFWCVKRDAFIKAGGLNEKTFLYYEENLFSYKIKEQGLSVAILTKERYDHFHSVSIKKRFKGKRKAYRHFHKGMLTYLEDCVKINFLQKIIFELCFLLGYFERVIYDLIKGIKKD